MVTAESPSDTTRVAVVATPRRRSVRETFACWWDRDLLAAGIEPGASRFITTGAPALALGLLGAIALAAILAPDPGGRVAPLALVLLGLASLPWLLWLVRGDDGPTWTFLALALAPIAALGAGRGFVNDLALGSEVAYALLAFPSLLLVVLGVAFAPVRVAMGYAVAPYAAYGLPGIAALATDHGMEAPLLTMWHVAFALSLVAGYAVRYSYHANRDVTAAREALAWQAAADERRQVARDVHDVVAHTLAVTMLHMTAARMAVQREAPEAAVAALEEAERQGRASLADIRRIVRLLRADDASVASREATPGLEDVQALVEAYRAAGLPVALSMTLERSTPAPVAELALYRVLQEALTNAARHGTGPATVRIEATGQGMALRVTNPAGQRAPRQGRGSGLLGMRERIVAAGGTIATGVEAGQWVVRATIPGEAA